MIISDCFKKELVQIDLDVEDKNQVFRKVAESFAKAGFISDDEPLYEKLLLREELMTTGIGNSFAIPHAFIKEFDKTIIYFARLSKPIDFKALDNKAVQYVFALVGPEKKDSVHLKILAKLSRIIQREEFKDALKSLRESGDFISLIKDYDNQV